MVIRPGRRVRLLRRLRLHVHHDVRHAAALRADHQERVRVRPAQDDAHGAKSVTPTEIQQHRTAVTLYRNQTEERRTQCLVHGCCEIRLLYLRDKISLSVWIRGHNAVKANVLLQFSADKCVLCVVFSKHYRCFKLCPHLRDIILTRVQWTDNRKQVEIKLTYSDILKG